MKKLPLRGRSLALLAVILPLLALFIYVGLRSGPLAPVAVTIETMEPQELSPALFGIGTVEARHTYRIGPTFAGRIARLDVDVGDRVTAGQVLGEMDPVDLDDRLRAQESVLRGAQAALREAEVRRTHARTQARRYEQLFAVRASSEELMTTKRQELEIAEAGLASAREALEGARSSLEALVAQRRDLRLIAPADGLVAARDAEPGTSVAGGQTVVEIIDPASLWIDVRFDQIGAAGLAAGLPARIALRSRDGLSASGRVLRVEPKADAMTEELLAKVSFDAIPQPLPPLGELAEVTIALPTLPATPVISNAALRREGERIGVWQAVDGGLRFAPLVLGAADLEGRVQVREGLEAGDRVVSYSERPLSANSRIHVVDRLPGVAR